MSNITFGPITLARSNNSDQVLLKDGEIFAFVDLWDDAADSADVVWSIMKPNGVQVFRTGSLAYITMGLS